MALCFGTEINVNSSSSGGVEVSVHSNGWVVAEHEASESDKSSGIMKVVEVGSTSERYLNECRRVTRLVSGLKSFTAPL